MSRNLKTLQDTKKIDVIETSLSTTDTDLIDHVSDTSNPHSVTKSQVGLGNVDNTTDLNKPISTATQTALDLKANQSTTYSKTEVDTAISAATPTFDTILNKPSTLSGYGITDAYTKTEVDSAISASTPTFSSLTGKPTTVSGYGITDAYTKTQTDTNISTAISNLVNSAPATLDTLNELATALGNDANFSTTITNSLGTKANLSGATFTGAVTHSAGSTLNGGITADTSVINIGSGQIYKDTSGNVGIGTSSPSVGLNVKGNGVKGGIVSQGDSEGWLTIAGNFNDPLIAWKSNGALRFGTETDTYTTGWVERMRIDSSGNVGIGVTPSGWSTPQKAIQIGSGGSFSADLYNTTYMNANAYQSASGWKYREAREAGQYIIDNNYHYWKIAPLGTVDGAITWTTAMTLDTSSNLAVAGTVKSSSAFFLNPTTISTSYTIPSGNNAMTAGPITVADGVSIVVPNGSSWTIV